MTLTDVTALRFPIPGTLAIGVTNIVGSGHEVRLDTDGAVFIPGPFPGSSTLVESLNGVRYEVFLFDMTAASAGIGTDIPVAATLFDIQSPQLPDGDPVAFKVGGAGPLTFTANTVYTGATRLLAPVNRRAARSDASRWLLIRRHAHVCVCRPGYCAVRQPSWRCRGVSAETQHHHRALLMLTQCGTAPRQRCSGLRPPRRLQLEILEP